MVFAESKKATSEVQWIQGLLVKRFWAATVWPMHFGCYSGLLLKTNPFQVLPRSQCSLQAT